MPCYQCALCSGGELSCGAFVNRRLYVPQEDLTWVKFELGISADINFVAAIGIKPILDIFNLDNIAYTAQLLGKLRQYT